MNAFDKLKGSIKHQETPWTIIDSPKKYKCVNGLCNKVIECNEAIRALVQRGVPKILRCPECNARVVSFGSYRNFDLEAAKSCT